MLTYNLNSIYLFLYYPLLHEAFNLVLSQMIKWFAPNNLILYLDKMNTMKFITKNSSHSTLHTGYTEKYIEKTENTKFLGLQIDNQINQKNHTEQMIPKLSAACYVVRSMVHIGNTNKLKSIYDTYSHSIINSGKIFWHTSSISGKIFTLQMQIVRIMAGAQPRTSCKSLFKQLEVLPVSCLYILSLRNFIISNVEIFQTS